MKLHNIYFVTAAALLTVLTGCKQDDPDSHDFTNKVYIEAATKPVTTYLRGTISETTKSFRASMADPAVEDIRLTCSVAPDMVATYNAAFYDQAALLPAENYEFSEREAYIRKGSIVSSELTVQFKRLDLLDTEKVYVLPIMLADASGMPMLERSRTTYYVFRGAALINIVGNIAKSYLDVNWKTPGVVNNLSKLTVETLVNVHNFDRGLSTILGIEGHFLLRIGDANIPSNQLQVATKQGNVPSSRNADLDLPTDQWVHIAVTYDNSQGGKIQVYLDGKLKVTGSAHYAPVNFGTYLPIGQETDKARGFHIGYAYSEDRYLDGEIAEVRIWNRVLTAEEINAKNHFYYVDPASDGLVTYWKFDDGNGGSVRDYTVNGNDATAMKPMKWVSVELPEKGK